MKKNSNYSLSVRIGSHWGWLSFKRSIITRSEKT